MTHKNSDKRIEVISQIIAQRRTEKVLADPATPVDFEADTRQHFDSILNRCVLSSTLAPFHYDRKHNGIAEPWRYHIVPANVCRQIAHKFFDWYPDAKPSNKLPGMLAACGALVLVTWLPQDPKDVSNEKAKQINEEHLMAASAAAQNLLLLLTAAGLGSYWSSGGQFREPAMFQRLSIPDHESLMGAIFVDYLSQNTPDQDTAQNILNRISGKHHDNRAGQKLIRTARLN